jgi:hypothetical protein
MRKTEVGEVVILDADNNTVESPFDDLGSLPQDVVSAALFFFFYVHCTFVQSK